MKKYAVVLGLMMGLVGNAFAVEVKSAKLDASKENILVDVAYGGGCEEHSFSLKVGACLESFPAQCRATLVDSNSTDRCEAYIHETVVISLKESGLTDSYYKRASLTIAGDSGKATVRLP
jgi:hypothetical protein